VLYPLLLQGLSFLWRVVLEAEDATVATAAIDLLTRLHCKIGGKCSVDVAVTQR
jgi:hypothetical protein